MHVILNVALMLVLYFVDDSIVDSDASMHSTDSAEKERDGEGVANEENGGDSDTEEEGSLNCLHPKLISFEVCVVVICLLLCLTIK